MTCAISNTRPKRNKLDAALQRLVEAEFDGLDQVVRRNGRAHPDVVEFLKPNEVTAQPPLSEDEQSFVSNAIAFLKDRKNADILIEEISRNYLSQPETEAIAAVNQDLEGKGDA